MPHVISCLPSLLAAFTPVDPDDWLTWMGPARNGVSAESEWSSEGSKEPLWQGEVGLGYSSFVVSKDRLYTLGYDKDGGMDVVFCLDANTGEEVWAHAYPAKLLDKFHGGGTLATPALDGDRVYTNEREGKLFCLDAASGEVLWSKDQVAEFGVTPPQWGFSASPYVHGDLVVINVGTVIAYDKKTGEVRWKSKDYGDAYSTPAPWTLAGKECLAVFAGKGLAVLALADGAEKALAPWKTQYDVNAMTPIVLGERVFISSGYEHGAQMLALEGDSFRVLWESKVMRNQMTGAIAWKDHLYGFDDSVLKCIDLEGKELWRERGLGKGALMIADGRLIILSEEGELVIAAAKPEAFEELSRAKVLDGAVCWTTPVLANGRIYCRNHAGNLVCLDHRLPKGQ